MLTNSPVKHLAQADLILVMDHEGRIVEQGKFAELNIPGSYIHDLKIELITEDKTSSEGRNDETQPSDETQQPLVAATKVQSDESRKTGDWTTYKYYARALGRWNLALFFIFVATNNACSSVSSKMIPTSTLAGDHC